MSEFGKTPMWRQVFDVVTTVIMIAIAVLIVWQIGAVPGEGESVRTRGVPAVPIDPIAVGGAWAEGRQDAPVAMVVFSDFECPFCGVFAREILPALRQDFIANGKLFLVFKHMPLDLHAMAKPAATASECVGGQEAFRVVHDRLFAPSVSLSADYIRSVALDASDDVEAFDRCMASEDAVKRVEADKAEARRLGVAGTPTFFIGRLSDGLVSVQEVATGAGTVERFRNLIEAVAAEG